MRTTVTLDSDVEQLLREAMRRGRKTFKGALNDAIRRGLKGVAADGEESFEVVARPLGLHSGIDPARLRDLDDELEITEFIRKTEALTKAAL